ncbi:MAG: PP2C family serine/threonine-protein phosphatase [Pirellulales bacterium]
MAESPGAGRSVLEHAALSDVGLRRANNQDSFALALAGDEAEWRRRGHLFMVADGMGAHAAGELASKMACESVPHTYRKSPERSPADALRLAIVAANANIHERGQANAEFQGMGTTSSVLVLLPRAAIVAHVGDSRVYRLRDGHLDQLTFDHSLVWEMMAAGQMPRGEVANFIPKNIITRSLGPRPDVQIDLEGPYPLAAGDTFLLCSDGLSGQVKDEEIGAILAALSPAEAVRALVDMANMRGGPDNVTAIVVRVTHVPPDEPAPVDTSTTVSSSGTPLVQFLWVVMTLGLLVAVALALTGNLAAALASGLVAAAAAVGALMSNLMHAQPAATANLAGPYGHGPHATHSGIPDAQRVAALSQMAQQLREAAKDEHWTLDWSRFNEFGEQARAAQAGGDFTQAVRQYALAISFMLSEIRRQPSRKDHRDSSVLDL